MVRFYLLLIFFFIFHTINSQDITVGAERISVYLPLLKNKKVAIVANQTSMVQNTHLVDTLLSLHVEVLKIFSPEHGFRGSEDAGAYVKNGLDIKTGLPIISLYGSNKKPKSSDLKGVDVIIFDIQDVGARFYTYISTMHYVMEACAENNITCLILDRPNPNGFYVDGPVLEEKYKSFVGMHPIPVVHGLTIGELADMINEEGWLTNFLKCDLKVIKCLGYTHKTLYQPPINPSPNLNHPTAIFLYPSICFFEGTVVSVGRGTDKPFRIIGHPLLDSFQIQFTPVSKPGAQKPMYENQLCKGFSLEDFGATTLLQIKQLYLPWLIGMYKSYPNKEAFFSNERFFDLLAGTKDLRIQIVENWSEEQIKATWKKKLDEYKKMRKKYLLYEDFE